MKQTRIIVISAGLALGSAAVAAQESGEASFTRPSYKLLRFEEDWSVFRDATDAQKDDFWDPLKYIPLDDAGDVWLSVGGHARARFEYWDDFAFGAPDPDEDEFLLWRMTLHADFHAGEWFRAFIEGKSALSTDRDLPGGRRTLEEDTLALEQAFIDIMLPIADDAQLTLRPGRQQFAFGKQRLVSPLPWSNTLRRWDGVSAILDLPGWQVHGFWSQFAPVQKFEFNDPDAQTQLFGVYATGAMPSTDIGLDLYFLGLDRDDPIAFNGTIGAEERYTFGGRLFGTFGDSGFDYDFEGAYQFGEVGPGDVDAFMIGSQLGYTAAELWGTPRFFIGFDYASGDDSPGGDVETFNQLFPLGHAYYGYADFVGRQNAIDLSIGAEVKPLAKLAVGVTGHFFWLEDDNDALYNAGGGVVRAAAAGADSELGAELDLTVKYQFDRHLSALAGYSHFFTGDFIEDTGPADDLDFIYLQLQYTF